MRFYMKYTYIKLIDGMTITYSESATKSGKSVFKKLSKTYKHPRTETMGAATLGELEKNLRELKAKPAMRDQVLESRGTTAGDITKGSFPTLVGKVDPERP